jgi:tetratricopeptide (TPR) repeat protein
MDAWFRSCFVLLLMVPGILLGQAKPTPPKKPASSPAPTAPAPAPTPEAPIDIDLILRKLEEGDYQAAVPMMENFLKANTGKVNPELIYQLAFGYQVLGQHAKAIDRLKEILANKDLEGKKESADLLERCAFSLPGIYSLVAGTQKDVARKSTLELSIKLYDDFLAKYPKSTRRGSVLYGKGSALSQLDRLPEAEKALDAFFKEGTAAHRNEATYLQANIYSKLAKKFQEEKNDDEAKKMLQSSRKLFDQLVSNLNDWVLINQVLFAQADVLLRSGANNDAIRALRKIKSKKFIEDQLQQRFEVIRAERMVAVKEKNRVRQEDLAREFGQISQDLEELKTKTPIYLNAQEMISQALFNEKKYHEVLILNQHFLPHFDADQKKRAQLVIVRGLVAAKEVDKGIKAYNDFKSNFASESKSLEDIPFFFADYFFREGKYAECVKWATEYLTLSPTGQYAENAYFRKASALTQSGPSKSKEAQAANEEFRAKFPKSSLAGAALFNKTYTQYQNKDYAAAITDFRAYIKEFPNTDTTETAKLLIGDSLFKTMKVDEAIKEFQEFEKEYPKSENLSSALYQLAQAFEIKKDLIKANDTYAKIVLNTPKKEVAAAAQMRIGQNFSRLGGTYTQEAIRSFEKFATKFPNHADVPRSYLCKAEVLLKVQKLQEAIFVYQDLIAKFPDSPEAANAQTTLGDLILYTANAMGAKPDKLTPEKQEEWKKKVGAAEKEYVEVLKKFPKAAAVDTAISQLSLIWQSRITAKFASKEEARAQLEKLGADADPSIKIKIAFAVGSLLSKLDDKQAALQVLTSAYNNSEGISLPNEGYAQYRVLLIENHQYDKVLRVSERQLKEKKEAGDTSGIADAHYGLGLAYFEKKDWDNALTHFKEVTEKFAWREPANSESQFYLAWVQESKKNYSEALKQYALVLDKSKEQATRARVMLRMGYTSTVPKDALASFLGVGTRYGAFPEYASEGFYMAGVLCEKGNVPKGTDPADPTKKIFYTTQDAVDYYKRCANQFPTTTWADQSRQALRRLGK